MTLMADDGGHRWTHDLLFTPHRVVVAGLMSGSLRRMGSPCIASTTARRSTKAERSAAVSPP